MTPKKRFVARLDGIIEAQDAEQSWNIFSFDRTGIDDVDYLQELQRLFQEPWHHGHNDLAFAFADHPV